MLRARLSAEMVAFRRRTGVAPDFAVVGTLLHADFCVLVEQATPDLFVRPLAHGAPIVVLGVTILLAHDLPRDAMTVLASSAAFPRPVPPDNRMLRRRRA